MLDVKAEDKKGGLLTTHQNALKIINQNCEKLNLTDIWKTLKARKNTRIHGARRSPKLNADLVSF